MAAVGEVAGRFTIREVGGVPARLMLAKNPAGWSELLSLVGRDTGPIVISINARTADGADPSWLWDVPFERLPARVVVATGDRCRDLSVRLDYAGIAHVMESDPVAAVRLARSLHDADRERAKSDGATSEVAPTEGAAVDVIGNYTAFGELLRSKP
jgi:UDP-N-acetylmuramyl tripeptide synthase